MVSSLQNEVDTGGFGSRVGARKVVLILQCGRVSHVLHRVFQPDLTTSFAPLSSKTSDPLCPSATLMLAREPPSVPDSGPRFIVAGAAALLLLLVEGPDH